MGKQTILYKIRRFIGKICFKIFLWSIEMTEENYWSLIYDQEKYIKDKKLGIQLHEVD